MDIPNSFDTMTEAVSWFQHHGYSHDFNLDKDCIILAGGKRLWPGEFHIEKSYRFEGMTDPGDEDILYAISSKNEDVKGILVAAYGTYADSLSEEMIAKLAHPTPA